MSKSPTPLFTYVGPRYRVAWNPLTKFYDVADMDTGGYADRSTSRYRANAIAAELNRRVRESRKDDEPGERRVETPVDDRPRFYYRMYGERHYVYDRSDGACVLSTSSGSKAKRTLDKLNKIDREDKENA